MSYMYPIPGPRPAFDPHRVIQTGFPLLEATKDSDNPLDL